MEGHRGRALTVAFELRDTDPETARVVAIHRRDGIILGAGCVWDNKHIVTCRHVVHKAFPVGTQPVGKNIYVTLMGLQRVRTFDSVVLHVCPDPGQQNDLALLELMDADVDVPMAEFARPLHHGGKAYSVFGFPRGDRQGRNVTGFLHGADGTGLVQMDGNSALPVLGGFSGAPVWSPSVSAFVGMVVTELSAAGVSWFIPSRRICEFFPDLRVRFRIPPSDRPVIHDWDVDDPNVRLFGTTSNNGARSFTATVRRSGSNYQVDLTYTILPSSPPPRGQIVTFVTYPDFKRDKADGYELFADIQDGKAVQDILAWDPFTVAAIGDAGDTVLTLDLAAECQKQLAPTRRRKKKKR